VRAGTLCDLWFLGHCAGEWLFEDCERPFSPAIECHSIQQVAAEDGVLELPIMPEVALKDPLLAHLLEQCPVARE
jgi:hypothetical protein